MKKVISILLVLISLFSLSAISFADENDGTGSVTGNMADTSAASNAADSGIIDSAKLKGIIDSYVSANGLSGNNKVFSVGYCYTATGDTWYYDGDQWCYSASLYKIPVCMLLAEKEHNGEITADTQINSQYASGTVDTLEKKSIVNSDNYTGHAIVEYLGGTYSGKCADQTIKYTDLAQDYFPSDFTDYSYYSAKYYTQVLKTLFSQSDKFPRVMDYMKQDQAYHYLDGQLNGQYEVAQKYGAFEEKNGNKNYHSAGIIYTQNPIIVTIMTKNITSFEKHIGAVAKLLVDYTLSVDSELASYHQNQLIAQQEEAARIAREEQERLAQEAAAQQAAAQQAAQAQTPAAPQQAQAAVQPDTQTAAQNGNIFVDTVPAPQVAPQKETIFTLPVIIGLIALIVIFLIVFIVKLRNSRYEEDDDLDDDDFEDYMRGDISDLAPRRTEKNSRKTSEEKPAKKRYSKNDYDDLDEEEFESSFQRNYKTRKTVRDDEQLVADNRKKKKQQRDEEEFYDDSGYDVADNAGFADGYTDDYRDAYEENYSEFGADEYQPDYSEDGGESYERYDDFIEDLADYPEKYTEDYSGKDTAEFQDEYSDGYFDDSPRGGYTPRH